MSQDIKKRAGLDPATVAMIKKIQAIPVDHLSRMNWDAEVAEQTRAVMALHMEYRLGRRLKSAKYL